MQKSNQNSQYKGKFDINLFKLIRDSNNYTLALEYYLKKKTGFTGYSNGVSSMNITFEVLNMIIAKQATTKVSNEYHYIRSILNLYPDGTSNQIQRRLYITIKSTYNNNSPIRQCILYVMV